MFTRWKTRRHKSHLKCHAVFLGGVVVFVLETTTDRATLTDS